MSNSLSFSTGPLPKDCAKCAYVKNIESLQYDNPIERMSRRVFRGYLSHDTLNVNALRTLKGDESL